MQLNAYTADVEYAFVKGYGGKQEFIIIPDANAKLQLAAEQIQQLCARPGLGADAVLRVSRTDAHASSAAAAARTQTRWFVEQFNPDGSARPAVPAAVAVAAQYLVTHADLEWRCLVTVATTQGVFQADVAGSQVSLKKAATVASAASAAESDDPAREAEIVAPVRLIAEGLVWAPTPTT